MHKLLLSLLVWLYLKWAGKTQFSAALLFTLEKNTKVARYTMNNCITLSS